MVPPAKLKKSSWKDVKSAIKNYSMSNLHELIKRLYQLSGENKDFLHSHLSSGKGTLLPYKKIISRALYPDPIHDGDIDMEKAEKALKNYIAAEAGLESTADLMIYFVECGNKCTLDYGDINEEFYVSLVDVYEKAAQEVLKMKKSKQNAYLKKLKKIIVSVEEIGWGYPDDLREAYYDAFGQY
jgi:hypothetical protein